MFPNVCYLSAQDTSKFLSRKEFITPAKSTSPYIFPVLTAGSIVCLVIPRGSNLDNSFFLSHHPPITLTLPTHLRLVTTCKSTALLPLCLRLSYLAPTSYNTVCKPSLCLHDQLPPRKPSSLHRTIVLKQRSYVT